MGSGASADARAAVSSLLLEKPVDLSDIKDLDQAKAELGKLRRAARDFQYQLTDETETKAGNTGPKKREAVMDRRGGAGSGGGGVYEAKVVEKNKDIQDVLMKIVTTNVLFSSYALEEHVAIVAAFDQQPCSAGTFVIRQGESGDKFFVVERGSLDIFVKSPTGGETKVGRPLGPGVSFGELALMYNTPRAASIKANTDCILWSIDRGQYRAILQHYKYIRNKQYMEFLRHVEIMGKKLGVVMSESELEKMTIALEREVFEEGSVIIRQGNTGDNFYIIADGSVRVVKTNAAGKDEELVVLQPGGYFGEKALLKEDVRAASCIAASKVTCLTLGREDFIEMMGSVEDMMAAKPKEEIPAAPIVELSTTPSAFSMNLRLSDLEMKSTLGCGAFSRVKLCRHLAGDQYFALKCQSKRAIVDTGLQEHILTEMKIMRMIDHPYIAKLYCALQDSAYIYFVLELLQGGELFTHLKMKGKLTEQSARFYAATVVYAFSALHAKRVSYRDLKPENLVLDTNGFIKLVDFGLAKQLLSGKTWTLCGTPDYLAPEIILNEGHDLAVDYWALGVLIFEMVVGAPPFYAEDPMEVYEKILSGNPPMPSFFTRNLSDLLKKLLRSQQGKRLGNTKGGTAAVIKHKWFNSFDWAGLETGTLKAPFKPTIATKDDVTNFDQFDEDEIAPACDWNPDLNA